MTARPRPATVAVALAFACAAGAAGVAGSARANCPEPPPRLVWSYPADGAIDVPTNARVFALTSAWQHMPEQIAVNGVAVARAQVPYGYQPVLAPNMEYVVTLPSGGSRPVTLSFRFNTGAGPAPEPAPVPANVERVITAASRELTPVCAAALRAIDCFDQGQDTHLVFETAARPLYWLVEHRFTRSGNGEWSFPRVWPGECGPPLDFVDGRLPSCKDTRYRLTTVTLTGETMAAEVACPASTARGEAAGSGGCTLGSRSAAASLVAVIAVAFASSFLARRRRRARRP